MLEKKVEYSIQEQTTTAISANPVFVAVLFFLIAYFFRFVDIFVLQMDQTVWGILPSKVIPIVLFILYLKYKGRKISELGVHSNLFATNMVLALLAVVIFNGIQTGGPYLFLALTSSQPQISIYKMDYIFYDVVFHIVNAFMEEMLFRGIMLRCFMTRMSSLKANILQSFLFGLWHIIWPISDFLGGFITGDYALRWALEYILTSGSIGFLWGFMFLKSSSLISTILMHFSVNMVEIYITIDGTPPVPRLGILMLGLLSLIMTYIMSYFYTKRKVMPQLTPWDKNPLREQTVTEPGHIEGVT